MIAPERPIHFAGSGRYAWWEIDPRYGTTTAVTDEGLHQATVEAGILRDDKRVGVFFRIGNGRRAIRRMYWCESEFEDNFFINQMARRLEQAGVDVIWPLAGF